MGVRRNENRKKRMCIDYSQTINKFTLLDAQAQYKNRRVGTVPLRDVAPVPDKNMHQINDDARQQLEGRDTDETPNLVTGVHPTGLAAPKASICGNSSTTNGPTDVKENSQELRRASRQSRAPDRFHLYK